MKQKFVAFREFALIWALSSSGYVLAQPQDNTFPGQGGLPMTAGFQPPDGAPPGFDGPPPFEPGRLGGFGPGGPGGPMQQETKVVKEFDKDGNGWLNKTERQAAREFLKKQSNGRRFGGPGRGFGQGPARDELQSPKPGAKVNPADVKFYGDAPLYASNVLRTLFLEFEDDDWEKELADFKNTDVEVPARLIVEGKTYSDVGVHFHGMSSYMMVGEGQKRSLVLTLDFIHADQQILGYRKLNLLNSHEDPSFLHSVLALQIARDYGPAPNANFVRVVINGESWGVYVNQQHFNKDFTREWFGTTKGARWKVPGSPNGHGGLEYLGEDLAAYKAIYEIKSKDDPKSWAELAKLCKTLNQTPAEKLEETLSPLLDIEGALKFLAWEVVLANGDGFYTRASDYDLYMDPKGQFHIIHYDANESFSSGGGPGGRGGPGRMGGPGRPGRFGPSAFLAPQMIDQGDKNEDGKLTKEEFVALADTWFDKLDSQKTGKINSEHLSENLGAILVLPGPARPPGQLGQRGPGGGFGPGRFVGPALFAAIDNDKDGSVTRGELRAAFTKWFGEWDKESRGTLDQESIGNGLTAVLPAPAFGGRGGPPGGPGGGGRGPGGPGGGGVKLEPLVAVADSSKPLISKLLAVPALRARYLGYVRHMAEKWLDWDRIGSLAKDYHNLIAADIKADTRKLDSYEDFETSLQGGTSGTSQGGSLRSFVEERRAFLLNHAELTNASR